MSGEQLNRIEEALTSLKTDVTSLKTDVTSLKTDVAALKTDMASVYARVDQGFAVVDRRFDELRGQLKLEIESVRDGVRILAEHYTPLERRVTAIERRLPPR